MTARRLLIGTPMDELDEIARLEIQEGWDVLDADRELIGQVAEVRDASFAVETSVGGLLEVAFSDIESADDGRVSLMVTGEELGADSGLVG